jgi:hypothetical protein
MHEAEEAAEQENAAEPAEDTAASKPDIPALA